MNSKSLEEEEITDVLGVKNKGKNHLMKIQLTVFKTMQKVAEALKI
jgi:hypothetical protein